MSFLENARSLEKELADGTISIEGNDVIYHAKNVVYREIKLGDYDINLTKCTGERVDGRSSRFSESLGHTRRCHPHLYQSPPYKEDAPMYLCLGGYRRCYSKAQSRGDVLTCIDTIDLVLNNPQKYDPFWFYCGCFEYRDLRRFAGDSRPEYQCETCGEVSDEQKCPHCLTKTAVST